MLSELSVNEDLNPIYNPAMMTLQKTLKTKGKKRILIIDDDQDLSELLKSLLGSDKNLTIKTAQDPFEAIDMMTEQVFDMIVLDWNLPKMNGLETLLQTEKWFKSDPNLLSEWDNRKVPVVIFSANEKSQCKAPYTKHFRFSGYVNKSNSFEKIISNLKSYFQKSIA